MILKKSILLAILILSFLYLPAQCWNLVWEDDFNGTSLDANNWSYQIGDGGWGNNELQYYRDGNNNVTVSGGTLQIIAKEESYMGADYTSARIRTINKGDWTHGKMEGRMKLPVGQGIWPACWMMPTDNVFGGWPNSGEIDIMEYLGHETNKAYGTIHHILNGSHSYTGDNYVLASGGFNDAFHTFSVEWESGAVRWYIDDVLYHSVTEASLGIDPWVFDENFHFILNMAVGGNWPGSPDGTTVFPQTFEIDYLRVYQQLSEIAMEGDSYVQPGDLGIEYSVPEISGATYIWSVPSGAAILIGQGTNTIVVNWGSNSGDVTCEITTACGTEDILFFTEVNPNYFENPAFENDFANWNSHSNGGAADFTITTNAPQEGVNAAQVSVTTSGTNPWDIQLSRSGFALEAGEEYSLSFWAKSETAGLTFPVAFIKDESPWTLYEGTSFTTSLVWQEYTLSFTAAVTDDVLFNIDLGSNIAVYYFDNFIFGKTNALPVELASFTAQQFTSQEVLLKWSTYSELNNDYFEIMRSSDGLNFESIGKIDGHGNSNKIEQYQFSDKEPKRGKNYYQLLQVDFDGSASKSSIEVVDLDFQEVAIFPNPVTEKLVITGFKGGMIQLVNQEGKLVLQKYYEAADKITLDLSHLDVGVYFLNGDEMSLKFVKE